MKKIELTQGEFALVDDDDFEELNKLSWHLEVRGSRKYARTRYFYQVGKSLMIYMHRMILKTKKGMRTDHIDHNGLNNQKYNLRESTPSQNNANRRSLNGSTSKYLGVFFDKRTNKWVAKISKNDKSIWLGRHHTEIGAAEAYNRAAIKIHGDFANLNTV